MVRGMPVAGSLLVHHVFKVTWYGLSHKYANADIGDMQTMRNNAQ